MMPDDKLLATIRRCLDGFGSITEKKMFGGVGFMLDGKLAVGASRRGLLLRVGRDRAAAVLEQKHTRPLVMRGKQLPDYVYLDHAGCTSQAVSRCLDQVIPFVQTVKPKKKSR